MPSKSSYFEPKLVSEYDFSEVSSNLQKMIRRGKEYEAAYSAFLFHQSGFGQYVWRRLAIIVSEDVGNGTPEAPTVVHALQQSWEALHKHNKEVYLDKFLPILQAVLYLCRCKKSREGDSLANLLEEHYKANKRLIIDQVSIDPHTDKGKKLYGKFSDHDDVSRQTARLDRWFNEGAVVTNKAYDDPWEETLKAIWYGNVTDYSKSK